LIGPAYASDFGGVYQCQLNSSGRQLVLKYGLHSTKVLTLDGGAAFSFGVRNSGTDVTSISEIGLCAGLLSPTSAQESFYFNNISGGLPGERLTGLGLTILSAGRDYGTVTAEASFSDGTSAVASRHIREPAGLGDTFFGFASPFGTSITSMNLSSPSGRQFFFDDVVFMTVPEPNSITLVMVGVAAFLCLRFQALRRYADVFRRCVLRSVGR
jgi:hypothetical protein